MDPNQQLSENFTLGELIKSDTALRHGLDNTPNREQIYNLKRLTREVLQPVRDHFGPVHVNSGFRGNEVNTAVRGSKTSDHCKGYAADIEVSGRSNYELAVWISDNLDYKQLILEFYTLGVPNSGWVHVSYGEDYENDKEDLTATKKNGRTVYMEGLYA
jgi:uncharacterized protein YcbK (DUF882 family)